MATLLLVIHVFLAIALVIVVLLQRSEGGALGIGGSGGGMMSRRGSANLLTRTTAILAALFMGTSLSLAVLAGVNRQPRSIMDVAPTQSAPSAPAPAAPAQPTVPSR
ncbi:MAG: preprotein translocase subunit SecG [Gemmatimonas sp.]